MLNRPDERERPGGLFGSLVHAMGLAPAGRLDALAAPGVSEESGAPVRSGFGGGGSAAALVPAARDIVEFQRSLTWRAGCGIEKSFVYLTLQLRTHGSIGRATDS